MYHRSEVELRRKKISGFIAWIVASAFITLSFVLALSLYSTEIALRRAADEIEGLHRESSERSSNSQFESHEATRPSSRIVNKSDPSDRAQIQAKTVEWMRRKELPMAQFFPIEAGNTLSTQLAVALGLTEAEYDRLTAVIKEAKLQIDTLAIQSATMRASGDGANLNIVIPPITDGVGDVYKGVIGTFSEVLGPERYQLFNAIAGESFEASLDRFGLNAVTYDVGSIPGDGKGEPDYFITRNYTDASGNSSGSTGGRYSSSELKKAYPVLAHFVFTQSVGRNSQVTTK